MTSNEQSNQPFWLTLNNRKPSARAALRQGNKGVGTAMRWRTRNTAQ